MILEGGDNRERSTVPRCRRQSTCGAGWAPARHSTGGCGSSRWAVECSFSDIQKVCYRLLLVIPLKDADMPQTLVVSGRGQITLPAATRKRLGIKGGDVVILEDRGNEIVLKPGMVLEVQHYSEDQVAQWDADDRLEDRERERILDAVSATSSSNSRTAAPPSASFLPARSMAWIPLVPS